MGKTQEPGSYRLVDHPQDVEVTGALPVSLTTFVGRERELDELRSLFRRGKRLVTLVGIGGIGKTRLALELGFSASDLGWANVYLVELASLTGPDLVGGAVLESVGGGSSRSPLRAAAEYLREANALLVLDCCEHVLGAARRVAEVLLRRCPSVAVLATSRSPLDIEGELVWQVPSLSMQKRGDAGEAGMSDAARLFADRASHVQARFELSEDVAGAVEAIVRRVDGIPLAIELAAARVRVLSAEEIAVGLDDRLRLLRGGHRSDPRHQTIRASLDWSHELLTDRERQLFARVSVFSGGFDLEAAAAVCAGGGIVPGQILDEIQGLVDKSLLAVERGAGATRFRMLDFVRQYAAERLTAAGEDVPLADRHRAYFRELAERTDRELWALAPAGRARLDDESPNLRAAIDDGCTRAPDDALAMVGALGLYWRVRGRLAEGVAATEQSLGAAPPVPSPGQALALAKLSVLSFWLGDFARTQSSATSALEMGAAIGDTRSQALALSRLGALVILSDPGTGDPMLLPAAELARAAGDQVALCDALGSLAISYFCQDDPSAMRIPLEETLRVAEAIGYEDDIRWCLWCLAHTAFSAGDLAGARAQGERALAMLPGQDPLSRYCAIEVLSLLDANMGEADAARERAEADFEQSRQERLRLGTGVLMHALGVAALAAGDLDRAGQWASSLYEQESEVCYLAWHAQEILVAVALARDDGAQAKIHVERLLAAAEPLRNRRAQAIAHLGNPILVMRPHLPALDHGRRGQGARVTAGCARCRAAAPAPGQRNGPGEFAGLPVTVLRDGVDPRGARVQFADQRGGLRSVRRGVAVRKVPGRLGGQPRRGPTSARKDRALWVAADPAGRSLPEADPSAAIDHGGMSPNPGRGPAISAHRGGSEHGPGGTYEAYQNAPAVGADYAEFDVRQTRDGILVAWHEERAREGLRGRPVATVSYSRLCQLAGFEVPQVAEVMRLLAGRARAHVDLKETRCATAVTRLGLEVLGPAGCS